MILFVDVPALGWNVMLSLILIDPCALRVAFPSPVGLSIKVTLPALFVATPAEAINGFEATPPVVGSS
jgi:hypothetical protein